MVYPLPGEQTNSRNSNEVHHTKKQTKHFSLNYTIFLQNLLFYYDNEHSVKPSGIIFLEGSYCERLITPPSCVGSPAIKSSQKEEKLQVFSNKKWMLIKKFMIVFRGNVRFFITLCRHNEKKSSAGNWLCTKYICSHCVFLSRFQNNEILSELRMDLKTTQVHFHNNSNYVLVFSWMSVKIKSNERKIIFLLHKIHWDPYKRECIEVAVDGDCTMYIIIFLRIFFIC